MSKLSKSLPYHLFVEGKNDLHVVSSLCGLHHVNQNFNIKVCESVENAIGLFRLTLTNPSAYPRIGVVLDADTDVEKRWRQLFYVICLLGLRMMLVLCGDMVKICLII